jgi:hydrophobe/amphiphile efflux-1 (HAE1) family protein
VLSRFFIERPRFAAVLSIVIVLGGVLSGLQLPISQFPDITPPVVQVTAVYPGANAEVLEATVATPIEEEVNGVDDMLYMSSTSSNNGVMSLAISFEVGTDPDLAQVNVQNRVALAESSLPDEVRRQGISVRKQSTDILLFLNLYSPEGEFDSLFLSNYALNQLRDPLLRVAGVGDVRIFGSQRYSMRIWLDPPRLAGLGLTAGDVAAALREQNVQVAAGRVGEPPASPDQQFTYTVRTQGRLGEVEEFEDVIVRAEPDGSIVRVGDVARVELGAESYDSFAELNGRPTTAMAVYLQPGANAVATADAVDRTLGRIGRELPEGVTYEVTYDTTLFVRESLLEIGVTVAIASFLVIAIVYLFLGSARATLVPMATVPVSLVGALLLLALLDYSLNTVTLFGLVLAIGIVVDDAIVVVENVQRLIGEGLPPHQAAIRSMEEVTGPIVATTLVLLAVFVPVGSLPGITGELYRQFAVAISGAVVISSVNALTLSPALCAVLLRADAGARRAPLRWFEAFFERARLRYKRVVLALLRRTAAVLAGYALLVALAVVGYAKLPGAFLPDEDQGYFFVNAQLPEGAALPRTAAVLDEIRTVLANTPGVAGLIQVAGFNIVAGTSATNAGMTVVILEPWEERPGLAAVLDAVRGPFFGIRQANVFAFSPPSIRGLGRTGGFDFRLQDAAGRTPQDLAAAARALVIRANQAPEITGAFTTYQADVPQVYVDVDRRKAKTLEIPLESVHGALQANLGGLYVNDFNKFGRSYQVRMQADAEFRATPEDIERLYVRNAAGEMVPLSTIAETRAVIGPETLLRYNLFRSAQVSGSAAPGHSSGEAIAAMERVARETLPPGTSFEWSGITLQELRVSGQATVLIALALVFVYLFLVAQYESWTLPLAVILTVPVAAAGAVAALALLGIGNDIYAQIGLVMLVGLAAKNAILIVEFASQRRRAGRSIAMATLTASHLRLRAVMMTALSFVLGVLPLVVATGAGAASRHSLGTPVFGGMIAAAFAGTLAAPILYAVVQAGVERLGGRRARRR